MVLFGLLPLAALMLVIVAAFERTRNISTSVLLGGLGWAFGLMLTTEVLSFVNAITFWVVLLAWILAIAVALSVIASGPLPTRTIRPTPSAAAPTGVERTITGVLLIIGGITLVIALNCPPNNFDSQTYHLPRIKHWIQNHSLTFYPTSINRQLGYQNLAEVAILHLRLLSGSDRLNNLIQWLAGAGSIVAVGEIAIALGASRPGAMFARLTAATLPIGILESTSTQNDLVVTFFLLCTAERLLVCRKTRLPSDAALMATAAGLALATKGTAYLIGAPMGVWFLIEQFPVCRRSMAVLICCAILVLLPNVPSYLRTVAYSDALLALGSTNNAVLGPRAFLLNAVRNAAVNLATLDASLDQQLTALVVKSLAAIGLDANDGVVTYGGTTFEILPNQTDEDFAGNPLQLLLGAIAVVYAVFADDKVKLRQRYAVCLAAQAFLFIVALRWQPWITRLQLPLFALCAPLTSLLPIFRARGLPAATLAIMLIGGALPALLLNQTRAVLSLPGFVGSFWFKTPEQILFARQPDLQQQYETAVNYIVAHKDREIGLMLGRNDWEYPLWTLLRQTDLKNLRLEHVAVKGSARTLPYPLGAFLPMVLIVTTRNPPGQVTLNGRVFRKAIEMSAVIIYERER
jgi:hypothetical protein